MALESPPVDAITTSPSAIADDPLWYKDAVIYQVHVKAFFDRTTTASATSGA